MQQGRWVSYIYRYRNNVRCENTGFIKVQRMMCKMGDEARIQIGLKLYKNNPCRCMVYLLYNGNKVKYLSDMSFQAKERDTIIKRIEVSWQRPLDDVIPFDAYDGLFFVCDDGEILIGVWNECAVNPSQITSKIVSHNTVDNTNAEPDVSDELPDTSDEISIAAYDSAYESLATSESACRQMLESYPRLPLFADSQFIECVKIVPQDIGKLAMGNWKLGVNSFLSHGYYHYKYIMLGKVKFDKNESYVIGVPGVFTNKEKYLANMFGFSVFIPVKKAKMLTGNFGYWISEISME